ncbi:MAG: FtsX-like permease family protein [Hydrogenoanaerobacterium sp.]
MVAVKGALLKDTLRELWRTKARFISIFTIIALGVGFFAGLKATAPYMLSTADDYFAKSNLFDVHLISTMGFDEDDIAAVKATKSVAAVMPAYTLDTLVKTDGSNTVVKVHSLPPESAKSPAEKMNLPTLLEGRFPQKRGECVIDKQMRGNIGDTLTFFADAKQDPLSERLDTDSFTIVGKVRTPYYITFERGSSTIGNGSVSSYVMVPEEDFVIEFYTDLYVNSAGKEFLSSFSPEYKELTDSLADTLKKTGESRSVLRYNSIMDEANEKIADAEKELADGIETQQRELADARKKIDDGKKELADGKRTLAQKEQEYKDKIADGEKELADGAQEVKDGEQELADAKVELADAREKLNEGIEDFRYGYEVYSKEKKDALKMLRSSESKLQELREQIPQILQAAQGYSLLGGVAGALSQPGLPSGDSLRGIAAMLSQVPQFEQLAAAAEQFAALADANQLTEGMVKGLLGQVKGAQGEMQTKVGNQIDLATVTEDSLNSMIYEGENKIENGYNQLSEGGKEIEKAQRELDKGKQELADGEKKYEDGKKDLADAKQKLIDGKKELEDGKKEGKDKIAQAKRDIADAQVKIADAEVEYADGERDSNEEIADARVKIDDARVKLADVEKPKWYVQNREEALPGFGGYNENADRIDAIAKVFPVFFLLVAALVCLTTMTRMVEEKRTQIGTLKALGYGSVSIASGFLSYALVASVTGSAVGLAVGFQLFPKIIYGAYGIMYTMPPLISPFKWDYAIIATIVVIILTSITVIFASYKELAAVPAALMRPKAPKNGKRVFLERLPFLWNHLNFTQKVTMRNLVRYKKRMLMTVIGIAGCSALIVTGFGVKDSIASIVTKQFGEIFKYDVMAVLEADLPDSDKAEVQSIMSQSSYAMDSVLLFQKTYTASLNKEKVDGYLFVPNSAAETESFVVLRERLSGKKISLDETGIIMSEKACELLGAKLGDEITLSEKDGEEFKVPIAAITENYAGHYFYLSPVLYEKATGHMPDYNALLATMKESTTETRNAFSKELLDTDKVIVTSFTETTRATFTDMMKSLDYVVLVLIVSAGALAFVVLYNLTNINIAERVREIATIKVLGFYDKEVSAYIYRENILLTLIGMVAGLFGGVWLHRFVISTAEVSMVMFGRSIDPISFVYAGGITIIFALIVNWVMYFRLKKIDMVESLKSVE